MKKIIFLLLLVACQFTPPTKMPELPEINTGTSGVEISVPSLDDILMCADAEIIVGLKNAGSSDANGDYNFILEEQRLKPLLSKKGEFSLKGRSLINPVGDYDQVALKVFGSELEKDIESYQTPIIFQACYKYQTVASVPVCIDPDLRRINKDKVCTAQPVVLSSGQGAPVAVVSVEPMMVPENGMVTPVFGIKIRNLGTGSVVASDKAKAACSGAAVLESKVSIEAELQGAELDCKKTFILAPDADTEIACISKSSYGVAEGTFTSILTVKLDYGYVSTVAMPVAIKRFAGQTCKSEK